LLCNAVVDINLYDDSEGGGEVARKPVPRGSILVRMTQEDLDEIDAAIDHEHGKAGGDGDKPSRPDFVRAVLRRYLDKLREGK
jgi:hypothetical protein